MIPDENAAAWALFQKYHGNRLHNDQCQWTEFVDAWGTDNIHRQWNLCGAHLEYQARYDDALPPVPKNDV